jgi:hypothetical protein
MEFIRSPSWFPESTPKLSEFLEEVDEMFKQSAAPAAPALIGSVRETSMSRHANVKTRFS